MNVRLIQHVISIVTLLSLFILGPAFGRALLLWWDASRQRSLASQHIALATCTMIAITGLIVVYGFIWNANPKLVAWYSWIYSIPIEGDVNAEVSGYVDTSHQ
jgi:hypothetical protein